MAASQGYGKAVTSGSVFAYDVADTINSFIGEPTTNLALFGMGTAFSQDYVAVTITDDPGKGYRGSNAKKAVSTGTWNMYKYPRSGNYTATSSTQFVFSFKIKWDDGRTPTFTTGYIYVDAGNDYPGITITPLGDGWFLCYCTYGGTSSPVWLTGFETTNSGTCWVCDWQLEAKSHPTPYVGAGGTRSATQGLLPLVGNSTINLSNVSFDSNAQIYFDATNDYISLTPSNYGITNQFTIEVVCYPTSQVNGMFNFVGSNGSDRGIMAHWPWSSDYGYLDITNTSGGFFRWYKSSAGILNVKALYHFILNPNGQVVVKQNNKVMVPDGTDTFSGTVSIGSTNTIGAFGSDGNLSWGGNIWVFKIYNRALTDAETTQNYNKYKTRFNLS
jgi:hypothetical protein